MSDIDLDAPAGPDLRLLLQPHVRGDALAFFGVRPGAAAAALHALPWIPWTSADDATFEGRAYRNGRVFRIWPSGREEELPLSVRVERVLAGSGWLRVSELGVAVRVVNGNVVRLVVRGAPLSALDIREEADIPRRFGAFEGRTRSRGGVAYHYPSRAMMLAWDTEHQQLDYVCLGESDWREPELSARDLLDQLLHGWESFERSSWREPPRSDPLSHYGYLRVAALARAFDLGTVNDVATGSFIDRRAPEQHRPMMNALLERYDGAGPQRFAGAAIDASSVRFAYRYLLSYRRKAQPLFMHNNGWLETDRQTNALIRISAEVNAKLLAQLALIEDWLARLIDPAQRVVQERELIVRHGYPDVDMQKIREEVEWG
jgi:hypothetical protein